MHGIRPGFVQFYGFFAEAHHCEMSGALWSPRPFLIDWSLNSDVSSSSSGPIKLAGLPEHKKSHFHFQKCHFEISGFLGPTSDLNFCALFELYC